jgi:uncharacterized protein YndB with AHSA1/START domain
MDTHMPVATAGNALRATRRIPATPEAVFAAWTDPAQVKAWFGPRGMTIDEASVDLRAGGLHHTVMRDAAGKTWRNPMVIEQVEAPRLLVLRVPSGSDCPVVGSVGTLRFTPEGAGTRLEVAWHHPTEEQRAQHEAMGFAKGWGETLDKLTAHLIRPAACPMATPATIEHGWLHRLLGEWEYESECSMGPDGPPMKARGRESVRSLGGYWVIGEGEGEMPGGGHARWIVTMGFDAKAGRFRGSWVGSMMGHMFVYDGALSEDGRTLTLENEGPSFTGEGTARYRDIVEMVDDDTRILASEVQGEDGGWTRFMTGRFTRLRQA